MMNQEERDEIINEIKSSLDNSIAMLDELIQIEHMRRQRRTEFWDMMSDIFYYLAMSVGGGVILFILLRLIF